MKNAALWIYLTVKLTLQFNDVKLSVSVWIERTVEHQECPASELEKIEAEAEEKYLAQIAEKQVDETLAEPTEDELPEHPGSVKMYKKLSTETS